MYQVSKELNEAIHKIFENPEPAFLMLGSGPNKDSLGLQREAPLPVELPVLERVALLRRRLEDAIELFADQMDYYVEDDQDQFVYQAQATLIALREIKKFVPESETASKDDADKVFQEHGMVKSFR